jgi:hypothetical protein
MKKSIPSDRHKTRMSAIYVEPKSETEWHRPTDYTAFDAFAFLNAAVNDYSGQYHQGYITGDQPILKVEDRQLYDALEQWPERPKLVPPEWPTLPTGPKGSTP